MDPRNLPVTQPLNTPPNPTPAPSSSLLLVVVASVLSSLLWLGVIGQTFVLVPRCERLFGEFRMKLPTVTEWVIAGSRWVVPAVTIAVLVVCLALGKRSPWAWLFLLFLLPFVANVFIGVSLYFPYMELLDGFGLSGGGKK